MVITIALNFILVPRIGFMGAAIALTAGYGTMMLISYYFGQKFYPIAYPIGRIFLHFLVAGVLVLAGSLLSIKLFYLELVFKGVVIISFLFYIWYVHFKYLSPYALDYSHKYHQQSLTRFRYCGHWRCSFAGLAAR